jgi:hypothetical protein
MRLAPDPRKDGLPIRECSVLEEIVERCEREAMVGQMPVKHLRI